MNDTNNDTGGVNTNMKKLELVFPCANDSVSDLL